MVDNRREKGGNTRSISDHFEDILQCLECRNGSLEEQRDEKELRCQNCGMQFPVVNGRPILLRSDNELFRVQDYVAAPSLVVKQSIKKKVERFIPRLSVNLASANMLSRVREILSAEERATVLVVGGGQQRKWLDDRLGASGTVRTIYSDIDIAADVDLFADGHDLPFQNGCFDAVVTTAVLEHVMYPERVAGEMQRVLKNGGLLYSELLFMQQVHEGAYDFTRYTLSGHRRLFNQVEKLDCGMVAGPGTALGWAIENFFLAFARRNSARTLVKVGTRVFFGWVKYFDYLLVKRPEAMDGASCTYLLGRKIQGHIPDADIVAGYVGAKHVSHT